MSVDGYIYSSDEVISPYTNKPCTDGEVFNKEQVNMWCEVCQILIPSVTSSVQHVYGKSHRSKFKAKYAVIPKDEGKSIPNGKAEAKKSGVANLNGKGGNNSKRKNPEFLKKTTPIESKAAPPNKKNKQENGAKEDQKKTMATEVKCDDCDIVFNSTLDALIHFKGKRHIKKITALARAKQESGRLQTRGAAAQRGGQRGRSGNRPPRGYGGLRRGSNPVGSSFQGDLKNVPFDYGPSYGGMNNTPPAPNRYPNSLRVGGLDNTFRGRGTFDVTGQQRESYQSTAIESRPAQQNYDTGPLRNVQMGSPNDNYFSQAYKNEMTPSDPYGSYY